MWNIITLFTAADAVTQVGEQCIVADFTSGELYTLDPNSTQTSAVLLGRGWSSLSAIAGVPEDNVLLVADTIGALWRVDLKNAHPMESEVFTSKLGAAIQIAVPNPKVAYVLGRMVRRLPLPMSHQRVQTFRPRLPGEPMLQQRVVRIDLAGRQPVPDTVLSGLVGAAGLAVSTDESTAYITLAASGQLLAIDMANGDRRIVVEGLNNPGQCAWLDEARGSLLIIEGVGLVVVDTTNNRFRRIPRCPGKPQSVVHIGDQVVVAASSVIASINAAAIGSHQVLLSPPIAPIYIGGYARIAVDLGTTGIAIEELTFDIVEGPMFAGLSASRDDPFDPMHPQVILLAGPHAGTYTLRASDNNGTQIATMPFTITDHWTGKDGPSLAFTGANTANAFRGGWGSGVFPRNFTYGPNAIIGNRRIALVFVNTSDATLPPGTDSLYIDSLINGIACPDGVSRSVAAYYNEVSGGRLSIVLAGSSTVTLPAPWTTYHHQEKDGSWRNDTRTLIQAALLIAQSTIDFNGVDTAVFVIASPNGGLPDPADPRSPGRFCWPNAYLGTYILTEPQRPGVLYWYYSLTWAAMPAEWEKVDARRVYETLSHEIGHTLGMTDLYGDSRAIGSYDLMAWDGGLPSLSLPHKIMLGWVDPRHLRTYNFRIENPVLETITLTATELLGASPPPLGERAGAIVEVTEGRRYYFEYRSRQNATPSDPGPTQVADQSIPEDQRVIGLDVVAGWYHPPEQSKPIRFLPDDGDGQGPVLNVGEDYEEPDPTGNSIFRLQVVSADDDRATVQVSYQPPPSPEPPWPNGPDPSIRPWPGDGDWRSPDLSIINYSGTQWNIPWAGHLNTISATVKNSGLSDAKGVKVRFWVKDFTVSANAPEYYLGMLISDIPADSGYIFGMSWNAPVYSGASKNGFGSAHYCFVVRIEPQPGEVNPDNNEAQSNYTIVWTASSSAFSRQRIPVQVANPYTDRSVRVLLHAEQRLTWYRTYLEHTWLTLAPGEVRSVEAMFECIADQPGFDVPVAELYGVPNMVSVVAGVYELGSYTPAPIGGASIEVRAARAAQFTDLDVSRIRGSGRVILENDGSAVPEGSIVSLSGKELSGRDIIYQGHVGPNGTFEMATPGFASFQQGSVINVLYGGDFGIAPTNASVVLR